ncbi:MAG: bifunctional demethylmenaquinone methyltransferase/2-methoxy-6-polyprenyl-1,4-benzoquinol methylase UbiE [Flavobacteriales bacterium]
MKTEVKPYKNSPLSKKKQVEYMFDRISSRYDLLNHILSFGIDLSWRRKAVDLLYRFSPDELLDVATGTGDLAIMAARRVLGINVVGLDCSEKMLEIARKKILSRSLEERVSVVRGDSEAMLFEAESFDAVTVAFGVRNFERLENGLKEIHRVLKPAGVMIILEFSQPKGAFVKFVYNLYSHYISFVGRIFSKDVAAYDYLPRSVMAFPHGVQIKNILKSCGFLRPHVLSLTFGFVSIYIAMKR